MGKQRRKYTEEFKAEAVRLVLEGGHSLAGVARDLGLHQTQLRRWKQKHMDANGMGSPQRIVGNARDEELRRLKLDNLRLREERDILKKAVAIFSKGPK